MINVVNPQFGFSIIDLQLFIVLVIVLIQVIVSVLAFL